MAAKECVVLTSSTVSIAEQKNQIEKTKRILATNRIRFTEVDCSDEVNRPLRDRYFEASGVRGNFPQIFFREVATDEVTFFGGCAQLEELNDMSDVPKEIIEANGIPTMETVFAEVARVD